MMEPAEGVPLTPPVSRTSSFSERPSQEESDAPPAYSASYNPEGTDPRGEVQAEAIPAGIPHLDEVELNPVHTTTPVLVLPTTQPNPATQSIPMKDDQW